MDLKSIKGALKSAAGKASKAAHEAGISAYASAKGAVANAASTATGALRCTREYDLDAPVAASGGPGCLFTVVDGTRRGKGGATSKAAAAAAAAAADPTTPNSRVSVWLLDKRALTEDGRHSKEEVEQMLQLIRDDASRMLRLRHPGVLRLEQPLEETRTHIALVTEPVFASAADILAKGANLAGKQRERAKSLEQATGGAAGAASGDSSSGRGPSRGGTGGRLASAKLSQLEVKHGAAALAGALRFIHESAGLVLRGLNPSCVVVTSRGDWKIGVGAFAHARGGADGGNRADFYLGPSGAAVKSAAPGYGSSDSEAFVTGPLPLVPPAGYVAPELVLGPSGGYGAGYAATEPTAAADVFSLGAVVHELAGNPPLLGEACRASSGGSCEVSDGEYRRGLRNARFVGGGASVVSRMCAEDPMRRIGLAEVEHDAWFANDVGLAALRELDGFIQKDVLARAAFLQSLQGRWDLFDARVTQYRVLPPLLTELRTPELQPLVLPLILNLAERQTPEDFSDWTLPHLAPLLATATGHTLGTILKSTAAFADRVPSPEVFELYVLPAVLRGVAAPEVLVQEEALRQVTAAAHKVTPETLRCTVVPSLHKTAVDTTAAAVRVNALVALGKIAPCFTVPEFDATLDALHRIAANDRAAATVMCVLGVADAMGKVGGVNLIASRCLPLACPLMLAPGLNRAQIGTVSRVLGGMLRRVEEARVATAPPAPPPPKPSPNPNPNPKPGGGPGVGTGSGSDPFAASVAATDPSRLAHSAHTVNANAGEGTFAPARKVGVTPMRLTPPPGAVPMVSSATEQLTAALSAADDLETLFTDPGYRPTPPGPMFAGMNVHPGVGAGAGRTGRGALDAKEFSLL